MSFTYPLALVLLLAIPLVIYLGWPRQRFRRVRDSISVALRVVLMALLVLALAGAQVSQSANKLAVIFLVDVSDSLGSDVQDAQLAYVQEAMQRMGPDDLSGVVVFGADPSTERAVNAVRELGALQSQPVTSNTDLAQAIRHSIALFPSDAARRIVVLSDGRPTVGDTEAAVRQAAALGVEISFVAFAREPGPEVQVTDLSVPGSVTAGQPFDLSLTIDAEEATAATVTILDAGTILQRQEVELRQGSNSYTLTLPGSAAGFKDFHVQVEPVDNDSFYQNNQLSTFTQVVGPPRALLVSQSDAEVEHLLPALEEAGVTVDLARPSELPIGLAPLAQYDTVIMANVPATQLSNSRMEALDRYVRDLGGGLVFIGGPNSYAPGGYFRTPLENTLPLDTQIRDQQRLPQLTIAYVIDRSGSMGVPSPNGIANIELAKEAIIRSIDFLQPTDRAGVVSFDTVGYWIAELQPVLDRVGLQRLVASLRASGGTDILAGMRLVANTIVNDPSNRKHIILLTDGGASPANLVELADTLKREQDITTSVIAIGGGSADFLKDMAEAGGGNYHVVDLVETIPSIFTQETVLASRSYIIENPFVPVLTANSPIMDGIRSAPPLLGYVATTPKQTAQVILRGPAPFNDPLLASWQYGLGRAVAFTSDATSRWAANWVTWADFTRFWSQAVRWTITEGTSNNLESRVLLEGEQARLVVDARDDAGNFLNGLDLQASIVDPSLQANQLKLRQVAPGRYEALFDPGSEGAYFLGISGQGTLNGSPRQLRQTTGWVLSYSAEYDVQARGANVNLLNEIAQMTNGRDMRDDTALPFVHNLVARNAFTPLWPWLLLTALLLLPVDIAQRRLIITRSDLRRARLALFGNRGAAVAEGPSERLSSLIGAKERGRQRAEESATATVSALRASRERSRAGRAPGPETIPADPDRPHYEPSHASQTKPESGANVAEELLKNRRKRQQNRP
ncbi:MAG: VWA domain-containing protein [Anaerolineae bacterium]|nr:VWA domain-containing protein [Anaerolineae bacterium]